MRKKRNNKVDRAQFCHIRIGIKKVKFITYDGERMRYERIIQQVGGREQLIQLLRKYAPMTHPSPPGLYGGHCTAKEAKKSIDILCKWGFKRSKFEITVRFYVTQGGNIVPTNPPDPTTHVYDYSRENCLGFTRRSEAAEAAIKHYEYWIARCIDEKRRPSQPVSLEITNKDGIVVKKMNNGYKTIKKSP